ncbi:MAG: hypothetical protein JW778_02765 [Candidatus Altiarchaeota archaeon]|nr:hypothetical protein [Candidatus Altiarchaeota archaeon]
MNEKELKKQVNELRHEIDGREKEVKVLYSEIEVHRNGAVELKLQIDQAKESIKSSLEEAKLFLSKRDELNKEVAELKKKRKKISDKLRKLGEEIKAKKMKRDELNSKARGTREILGKLYQEKLAKILEGDIPLIDEIRLFDRIFEIEDRLDVVGKADELHTKISKEYEKIQKLNKTFDGVCKKIKSLAEESQESHERAMQIYHGVDDLRERSKQDHGKIKEKYEQINPLRDKVTALKQDIRVLREKLTPLNEELKSFKKQRDDRRRVEDTTKAKEKLQKKGRVSIDDLRVLLESGEISFE